MLNSLGPYLKAVIAFLVPGVVAVQTALTAGSPSGQTITLPEWVGIAAACILTSAGVYAAGNTTRQATEPDHVDPPLSPMEG